MNVIIPCAGQAKRFKEAGFKNIKPFILTKNKLMIEWVLSNLINRSYKQNFIFLFQEEHIQNYDVKYILFDVCKRLDIKRYEIVGINGLTDGSARTTLFAKELINNSEELVLANSDQFVSNFNIAELLGYSRGLDLDCSILTFSATDSKWSFVKRYKNSIYVDTVKEKEPISSLANVGIFYWKHGRDYVWSAEEMINKNIRVAGEFYTSPSINELILINKKVSNYHLNEYQKMWGLGTPFDHQNFELNYLKIA